MNERPLSVTIIGWLLIVLALLGAAGTILMLGNPASMRVMAASGLPVDIQIALSFAGLAVSLASGIGLLKRQNWARWLYVLWNVAAIVVALLTSPAKLLVLISVALLAIIAFFLFRAPANAWFRGGAAA
jgi:hypothetical protein